MTGLAGAGLQLYLYVNGCSAPGKRPVPPGRSLYSAKCGSCHRLLPPGDHTADVWQEYVAKYGKQATEQQRQEILNYLQENAKTAQHDKKPLSQ